MEPLWILAGIFLLISVIGGGFEAWVFKIPAVGIKPRMASAAVSLVLMLIALSLSYDSSQGQSGASAASESSTTQTNNPANANPASLNEPSTTTNTASSSSANSALQNELMASIKRASDLEAEAMRTQNPQLVASIYPPSLVNDITDEIREIARMGFYYVPRLHNQRFEYFNVSSDGRTAEVRVVETWSGAYYRLDNNACVGRMPTHDVPQTLSLRNTGGQWVITAMAHHSQAPEATTC